MVIIKLLAALILRRIYGVRGGLKPPIGHRPGSPPSMARIIAYKARVAHWRVISSIYDWSGLPEVWWRAQGGGGA